MAAQVPFQDISEWLDYWLRTPRLAEKEQAVLERYYYSFLNHFGDYVRKHYASQVQEVEEFVRDLPGCRVLEVGCGCGTESLWLGLQGASVTGIELNAERLATATARLQHTRQAFGADLDVQFRQLSAFDAVSLGRFDCIWMEQTFHHVEPRKEFLQLLGRLLKPGGVVIISESNGWNLLIQLQHFLQRGFRTIRYYTDRHGVTHFYGNERITTSGRLRRNMQRAGFEVESVRHYRLFPNRAWADRLQRVEYVVPTWIRPVFTHYNLVARWPG